MMRKTFNNIALVIRAVFLFGILVCNDVLSILTKTSKFYIYTTVIVCLIITSFNNEVFAQGNNCPPGQRVCIDGTCKPVRQCGQGVPPPPGLPIDSKLPYLLIAGLGLGIYFLRAKKTV